MLRYPIGAETRTQTCPVRRLPAAQIEGAAVEKLNRVLRALELVVRTWIAASEHEDRITEADVRKALVRHDPTLDELLPAKHVRRIQLLVDRFDVNADGIAIRLRTSGLTSMLAKLRSPTDQREVTQ